MNFITTLGLIYGPTKLEKIQFNLAAIKTNVGKTCASREDVLNRF